jgi:hypothetical protein
MHHDRNGCHSCPNQSSCRLDTGCQVLVAEIAGNVELLTHKDVEAVKRFYLDAFNAAGFNTRDLGYGTLNAPLANYLGIANTPQGYRNDTDLTVTVTTRTSSGLILPSRSVQIHWQKWDKSLPLTQAAAVSGH